jgi:hypothetical protein
VSPQRGFDLRAVASTVPDIPTLQRSIADLERSLTCLEHWLLFTTFLVALGLVLECLHEIPEALADFRKGLLLKPILIIGGLFLITVGVGGEVLVQFFASAQETSLRKANDDVSAILNTKAAEALAEAARLQKLAEDERLARVKIEEDVAWRRLTRDQQKIMAVRIKSFSSEPVFLFYNLNDLEAGSFATDIAGAYNKPNGRRCLSLNHLWRCGKGLFLSELILHSKRESSSPVTPIKRATALRILCEGYLKSLDLTPPGHRVTIPAPVVPRCV